MKMKIGRKKTHQEVETTAMRKRRWKRNLMGRGEREKKRRRSRR